MQKHERDLGERTFEFARRVVRLFAALPKSTVAQVIGKQVLRSGMSVGANYCEAERGRSRAEFISTMGICLRELNETHYWLKLLEAEEIVAPNKLASIIAETKELTAIFTTIIKRTKSSS